MHVGVRTLGLGWRPLPEVKHRTRANASEATTGTSRLPTGYPPQTQLKPPAATRAEAGRAGTYGKASYGKASPARLTRPLVHQLGPEIATAVVLAPVPRLLNQPPVVDQRSRPPTVEPQPAAQPHATPILSSGGKVGSVMGQVQRSICSGTNTALPGPKGCAGQMYVVFRQYEHRLTHSPVESVPSRQA